MLHTNCGELALLFDTYCRVWRAGGQASLTTSTKDGLVEANLKIQLGHPAAARAGAPPPQHRVFSSSPSPGHPGATHRQPCHRGPAAKAKSRARAALHQAAKAVTASTREEASPSSALAVSPDLPEGASPSHPNGASPPSAQPTPDSEGDLPLASTDPVEAPPASSTITSTPLSPAPTPTSNFSTSSEWKVVSSKQRPSGTASSRSSPASSPEKLWYNTYFDERQHMQCHIFKCKKGGTWGCDTPWKDLKPLKYHDTKIHGGSHEIS